MPVEDIRLRIDFREHPKTKRLMRVLGDSGVRCLVWLWLGAASRRSSGELYEWDAEEIEIEAGWNGAPHGFVDVLLQQGWLERDDSGLYRLHDWPVEQPFVVNAPARSQKASDAAKARWEKERAKLAASSPDAPSIPNASTPVDEARNASSMLGALLDPNVAQSSNTPTLPVPTLPERVGPGGSVVPFVPVGISGIAAAYEEAQFDGNKLDYANCGLFRTWVESDWLKIRSAAHIVAAIRTVAAMWHASGRTQPQMPIYMVRTLVNGVPEGGDFTRRTAGDGTAPWKPKRNASAELRAEAARLAAEGK